MVAVSSGDPCPRSVIPPRRSDGIRCTGGGSIPGVLLREFACAGDHLAGSCHFEGDQERGEMKRVKLLDCIAHALLSVSKIEGVLAYDGEEKHLRDFDYGGLFYDLGIRSGPCSGDRVFSDRDKARPLKAFEIL
jgi:hypothetical protein